MKNKRAIVLIIGVLIFVAVLGILLIEKDNDKPHQNITPPEASETTDENTQEDDTKDEAEQKVDEIVISSGEAVYEEWLAASVVTAISLTYPDFELQEILAATETDMGEMEQSEGVFVKFASGGEDLIIHAKPLTEERTKAGTADLHEEKLGFATFDIVKEEALKGEKLTAIDMNVLNELIAESLLVSIYEHY